MKNKFTDGFSLIEVLMSLFLFSLMLLGLENITIYAARENNQAWVRAVMINQITSMSERLHTLTDETDFNKVVTLWNLENSTILNQPRSNVVGTYPNYIIHLCVQSFCIEEEVHL